MPKKFKVVAVGTGDPGRPPILVGFLKTYVESRQSLKDRVSFTVLPITDYAGMEKTITAAGPDLVVLSPHEDWDNKSMFAVCARLKAWNPRLPIVTCAETPRNRIQFDEAFRDNLVDFVIHGESEAPLAELITHLLDGRPRVEKVRGITYMRDGDIRCNDSHPSIRDINDIPSPYLQGIFDLKAYRSAELVVSRGCKWKCRYCAINEGALRYFSTDRIKAELDVLLKQAPGLEEVSVIVFDMFDNTAIARPLLRWFHRIAREKGIRFQFDVNVNSLNKPELLKLINLEQFCIEVGVQSVYSGALGTSGRPSNLRQISKNIATLRRYAPKASTALSFIRGLPGDTVESYQDTLNWALSTGYDWLVNHLRILPGTGFDKERKRYGIQTGRRYPYFATATRTFARKDLQRMFSLTDRIGFVMKLASCDRSRALRHGLLSMGTALDRDIPRSFLTVTDKFCTHLEKSEHFGDMFRNYHGKRQSSDSFDWNLEYSDLGSFSHKMLLNEFLAFRNGMLKKYGKHLGMESGRPDAEPVLVTR